MKNDNEEQLIESLVTIGTLIFFGFLTMYVMRGCSDEDSLRGYLDSAPTTVAVEETSSIAETSTDEIEHKDSKKINVNSIKTNVGSTGIVDVDRDTTSMVPNEMMRVEKDIVDKRVEESQEIELEPTVRSARMIEMDVESTTVVNSDIKTTDKNVKEDNQQSEQIKELKDETEAKEEAGIIADIENERVSSKPYVLQGIYFKTGSSILTEKSNRQLDAIGKALKLHKDVIITLRGHTDKKGSSKKNEELSLNRAGSVGYALVKRGANIDNIWIIGVGELEPITSSDSDKEMSKNRRVDIAVTK